jgi:peptide/nickel transport system ATP-binding protein/oligopeptide transport system ATP-binding protein
MDGSTALLSVQDLSVYFPAPASSGFGRRRRGAIKAVDGVSLEVGEGEVAALVGESGCGKSTTALAILRLIQPTGGQILMEDEDIATLRDARLLAFRRSVQIVFQDPYSSLHPRKRIGQILDEPLRMHTEMNRSERRQRIAELLEAVGLDAEYVGNFPRELSGGQRQRIAIARAISIGPRLLVLDEPLSALDVSIRAQVLELLTRLRTERRLTYVFISHDLAVVRGFCETVTVMYLGKIVEHGTTEDVFARPVHPYTQALISAVPIPDPRAEARRARLVLHGEPPSPMNPPSGCRFRTRCPLAKALCAITEPALEEVIPGRTVACHFHDEAMMMRQQVGGVAAEDSSETTQRH